MPPSTSPAPPAPAAVCDSAVRQLDGCLGQLDALLERLGDEAYATPLDEIFGGSIGGHVRHCLDHVRTLAATAEAIVAGVAGEAGEDGTDGIDPADYDARDRGTPVESDRGLARAEIAGLRRRLGAACDLPLDAPADVSIMMSPDGQRISTRSTLGREVAFVFNHTIHHQAMIGGMARYLGVTPLHGFGRAPSTEAHEMDGASACAR